MKYIIKKLNSVFALISTLLIIVHLGMVLAVLYWHYYSPIVNTMAKIAATFIIIHAIFSIICLVFINKRLKIEYISNKLQMVVQRSTAVIMVLMLPMHVINFQNLFDGNYNSQVLTIFMNTYEICFYFIVLLHIASSFTNLLIRFGIITSNKTIVIVDTIVKLTCLAFFIAFACGIVPLTAFINGGMH